MPYTLGQAAQATGKSKATLLAAIKKGRISAAKNDLGQYAIDPAELHRVYPPTVRQCSEPNDTAPPPNPDQTGEIRMLKERVEGLERLCRQVEGERDSLRDQNNRLTALLPPPKPVQQGGFWRRLFRA